MKAKKLLLVAFLSTVCLSLTPISYHKVKFINDGDTITLDSGDRVRYLGIDAPEVDHGGGKSEFMAEAARDFNSGLVNKARVRLEFDHEKRDRHGRFLAYVFLQNGEMINALLVRKGLAHVMSKRPNFKYRKILLHCQRKAMQDKTGIWSRPLRSGEGFYLGNRYSYRFHRPDCPFGRKIYEKNLVRFKSFFDAFWAGYSPCKRCMR